MEKYGKNKNEKDNLKGSERKYESIRNDNEDEESNDNIGTNN